MSYEIEFINCVASVPLPALLLPGDMDGDYGRKRTHHEPESLPRRERPVVLVADDEPLIVRTLLEILQTEGYEAVGTRDGLEAVTQAERLKPDLLLLDIAMPRLDGVEAAKRIQAFSPASRVVLFSGQASSMDLLRDARSQGLKFEIVAKPVKPEALLTIIREMLN